MRYLFLIFTLLLLLPVADAGNGVVHRQGFPTTFITLNVVDENNQFVGEPVLIHVKSSVDGELIDDYSITLIMPSQNITVPWTADYRKSGTVVTLIASKDGYQNSEPFTFTITENTPKDGLLFTHDFVLTKLSSMPSIEINEIDENIRYLDNDFSVHLSSTSNIKEFTFEPDIKSIIFSLEENNPKGFLNVTIPRLLLGGPYRTVIDGFLGSTVQYPSVDYVTVQIDYLSGPHEITIKSQTIFQLDNPDPILNIDIIDGDFKSGDTVSITGTLLPIQPQAEIILTSTNPQDDVIIRTIDVLSDGSFEYKFTPMLEGRWNVFATYDFDGKIIKSNIIIFSIDPSPEPEESPEIIIEPAPEPAPELAPEPELVGEEPEKVENSELSEEIASSNDVNIRFNDEYLVFVIAIVIAAAAGLIFLKKDSLAKYQQKRNLTST